MDTSNHGTKQNKKMITTMITVNHNQKNNNNNIIIKLSITIIIFLLLLPASSTPALTRPESPTEYQSQQQQQQHNGRQYNQQRYRSSDKKSFNFAAYDVGAKILGSSPEAKKVSRILNEDKDNYMLIPRTAEKKWVTIELSEEILMHSFALANFEYYSCSPRIFQVLGSREYPCRAPKCYWEVLGTYEAHNTRTVQTFMLQRPSITRYVKFLFLTHYGDSEYFCTLSLIRVHGSTLLEDLKAALYDMGPHTEDVAAPDHHRSHHIYTQSAHKNSDSTTDDHSGSTISGSSSAQKSKNGDDSSSISSGGSGGRDGPNNNESVNHSDSPKNNIHLPPTHVTNPAQVDTHIFNVMKNVQQIASDDDSESILEIPILDPDLIRSIMDNMNIPKIREPNDGISQSSDITTNHQCSLLNPFLKQSFILKDGRNQTSEAAIFFSDNGSDTTLVFNHSNSLSSNEVSDGGNLDKTPLSVSNADSIENNSTQTSQSTVSESNLSRILFNYYQKQMNFCLLNESVSWQTDSNNPTSITNNSISNDSENHKANNTQHRIDAIQPTHVEPDKRVRSSKTESTNEEEEGEEAIAPPQPPQRTRKTYEETSDNILKSLLLKIQKQEDYSISLGRNLQKVHNKYVEAFRDIQNILNKTAHEHNVLASAVYSLSRELKDQIIEDVRREYERELHKVRIMNEYKMELLLHNLTETISNLREDTTRSVNGYKKFMVVCMTIPLIFMVFVLLLCIPTATQTEISQSKKLNTRAAKLAKLIYPLDDSRKQQRGQLYFDSDADDEDDIRDLDDEDKLVAVPRTPESKKLVERPASSIHTSTVEQSPAANKKPISLVNHLVSYLTDSETNSRSSSPKRGSAPNFTSETTKISPQQYHEQMDQHQHFAKINKLPPPIDTSRVKIGNTRDTRVADKLSSTSHKIAPNAVPKSAHPKHKYLKRSLSLGEDLIFERRAVSNSKSPAVSVANVPTGKRKTKRTKKTQ